LREMTLKGRGSLAPVGPLNSLTLWEPGNWRTKEKLKNLSGERLKTAKNLRTFWKAPKMCRPFKRWKPYGKGKIKGET